MMPLIQFFFNLQSKMTGFVFGTFSFLGKWTIFWSGMRSFAVRMIFLMVLLYVVLILVIVYLLPPICIYVLGNGGYDWNADLGRSSPVEIFDRKGRYIGYLESRYEPGFQTQWVIHGKTIPDPRLTVEPEPDQELVLTRDHKSSPVQEVPEYYWKCLRWSEDRHFRSIRNPWGIEIGATLQIFRGRGGSTLSMQLYRSLSKDYAAIMPDEPTIWQVIEKRRNDLSRKFAEWRYAPNLQHHLLETGGEKAFAKAVSNHMALIQGGEDYDVYGVNGAARILFGIDASGLSPAQELVLADAVREPFRFKVEKDLSYQVRQSRLDRMIYGRKKKGELPAQYAARRDGRPMQCAGIDEIVSPRIRDQVMMELLQIREKGLRPHVTPEIAQRLSDINVDPQLASIHPERYSSSVLAGGLEQAVVSALRKRFGAEYSSEISSVKLTIDAERNLRFVKSVSDALRQFESTKSWCDKAKLGHYLLDINGCGPNNQPVSVPITISVSNAAGELVRFFSTDKTYSYYGVWKSDQFQPGKREIASIGKVAAAILLAESGDQSLTDRYSNKCLPSLSSIWCDGNNNGKRSQIVTPPKAFGESLNDPLISHIVREVSDAKIDRFMREVGFDLPDSHQSTPASTRLVLGRYTGSPSDIQQLFQLSLSLIETGTANNQFLPRLYDSTDIRGKGQPEPSLNLYLEELDEHDRQYLKTVLEAPLCFYTGTLKKIGRWCSSKNDNIIHHIAKTGTRGLSGIDNRTRNIVYSEFDWWVGGAVRFSNSDGYSYVIRLGTGVPGQPFSKDAGAGSLAPIVSAVLKDLVNG